MIKYFAEKGINLNLSDIQKTAFIYCFDNFDKEGMRHLLSMGDLLDPTLGYSKIAFLFQKLIKKYEF